MCSTPVVDNEPSESPNNETSELPNQSPSLPAQLGTQTSKRKGGRESNHYWLVDAEDEEHGVTQKLKLKVKDVNDLPDALRIIVEFDDLFSPIGEAVGLLAGVCDILATNSLFFPISFDKWSDMPEKCFDDQWKDVFQARFCFKVIHQDLAKRFIQQSIGKKWKEYRLKLWDEFYDPTLSKSEIIKYVPEGVSMDQWTLYVTYQLKPETMELCKRNRESRKNQIPHTCGAKTLARRRHELKIETGKTIGRGLKWNITHKRKDGSYVIEKAMQIGEKIDHHISQCLEAYSEISPNDPVGVIFGAEHPNRVWGCGLGVVSTIAFKHTTTRLKGVDFGSSSGSTFSINLYRTNSGKFGVSSASIDCLITAKERGRIPEELAALFPNFTQQAHDIGSGASSPNTISRSSGGSNIQTPNGSLPSDT